MVTDSHWLKRFVETPEEEPETAEQIDYEVTLMVWSTDAQETGQQPAA